MRTNLRVVVVAVVLLTLLAVAVFAMLDPFSARIQGTVMDSDGPIAGARVRIQTTTRMTTTAANGTFTLHGVPEEEPFVVTAWADGYYVGWAEEVTANSEPITITLNPYYTTDNPDYGWFSMEGAEGSLSCSHCMPAYDEWIHDAHAQSAVNPRFLTMYNGTDVNGNQSPPTRFGYSRDYGSFPLPPDLSQPYYGPGYRLDFPNTAGNCSTCHVPVAAAYPRMAYAADPNEVEGIAAEGVFCEFCHKIGDAALNPATSLPYPNMPGVLSMQLYRPEGEAQLFLGPFDDVTRRVSYLPLEDESAFCAPCHFGVFWDTVIYNSYGEWLESPYSDPENGLTCQQCHMPILEDATYFVFPEQGGLERPPGTRFTHLMPGAADEEFLQNTAELVLTAERMGDEIHVTAEVTNANAGHHIPTDSPLRQIFLVVTTTDEEGNALPLREGPTLPDWAGDLAGESGVYFAMILQEIWTEITPTGAYWNPTRVLEDTRVPALATATSTYVFEAPEAGTVTIEADLIFRRAFYELMQQKGWDVPDILMETESVTVP